MVLHNPGTSRHRGLGVRYSRTIYSVKRFYLRQSGGRVYCWRLDLKHVKNRIRTAAQIAALYQSSGTPPPPPEPGAAPELELLLEEELDELELLEEEELELEDELPLEELDDDELEEELLLDDELEEMAPVYSSAPMS